MIAAFFAGLGRVLMSFCRVIQVSVAALMLPEGRRAWALVFLAGGGIGMSLYAMAALWAVRDNPRFAFWLGALAQFSVIIVLTGFAGLLVKRRIKGKVSENTEICIDDIEVVE